MRRDGLRARRLLAARTRRLSRELGVAPADPDRLACGARDRLGSSRCRDRADGQSPASTCSASRPGRRWQGPAVGSTTVEFEAGVASTRVERFRAYDSPAASFGDYVSLLKGASRYAAALGTGEDAAAFAGALQQGGYATDPDYARKLTSVVAGVRGILEAGLKPGDTLPIQPPERSI
jgi:peptidoglycan hydrolase FlgJ